LSKIEVNQVDTQCGSTLTLGSSGKTVTLASGASQSGFGRTGTVDWCTTAKTSPFTAVSGNGYFINTTSGAVTVTLPASPSAGDIVAIKDYANTFDTNNVTLARNGSKINGVCGCGNLNTESQSVTLIYVDGTKGWQDIHDSTSDVSGAPSFIVATGGTITTSGDFKIHTFTGDSTFTINSAPTPANNKVSYMVVAGGGGAGGWAPGGGGAGGYREGKASTDPYTASPLAATPCSALTLTAGSYPITVGAGGTGAPYPTRNSSTKGSNSVFSTITSAGGGVGAPNDTFAGHDCGPTVGNGGSGGGSTASPITVGSGNTPPVSPPQGNNGGTGTVNAPQGYFGGGGGGATAVGADAPNFVGGNGGAGATSSINTTPTARAGGGGAGTVCNGASSTGGAGGGGNGGSGGGVNPGSNGTANTGGGGGGAGATNPTGTTAGAGGSGGSGIVIIRYKFQ
jgi:hypothetical protein